MNKILKTFIIIFSVIVTSHNLNAQDENPLPVSFDLKQSVVDSLASQYHGWETMSCSGKLSSPMLPVTASVKLYMEKGELILITISAPLIGEAARIEIDKDKALLVNKIKNTFASVAMEEIEPMCPGGFEALQNILLGRVYIMGKGVLASSDASGLEVFNIDDATYMLLPNQDLEEAPYVYFYTIDKNNGNLQRLAVMSQNGEMEVDAYYTWGNKKMTLDLSGKINGRILEATLQLNSPDLSIKPISRMEMTSKYKETDLKGLMK